MRAIREKLAAFRRSRVGQFLKKVQDDRATDLAALLAWGTLSTLLPLLLGILALAGLVLRDPRLLDQVYGILVVALPEQAAGVLGSTLETIRQGAAAPAGIVGLALLLYNGARFFANMASVFNRVYHVEDRNALLKNAVAVLMLLAVSLLLVVSVTALGVGSAIGSLSAQLAGELPVGPIAARVVSWSLAVLSAVALFVLIYKILPNTSQGWGDVLPGALLATTLFFAILQVFPLYVALFPPNQAYAVFGIFLLFAFWLYLLGLVFVIGAELNAFLQDPARAVALAEATAEARGGDAALRREPARVEAEAVGTAPTDGGGGTPESRAGRRTAEADVARRAVPDATRRQAGGTLVGLVGLLVAALLLRTRRPAERRQA